MRIAIIGSGISGLVAAYRLAPEHDVTVFESNGYVGGHTNTVSVDVGGEQHEVDTGFIVYNDRTYPNFVALLDDLGVASDPTSMSFSVRSDVEDLEYNGTSLNGLFAQRRNLLRPRFHRMLLDIARFNREATSLLDSEPDEASTVFDFLNQRNYSREFSDYYLLPMGAAIWSCPLETFERFPVRFIAEFYHNHGLLSIRNRPTWRVIRGGSKRYVEKLTKPFADRIRLNSPIRSVRRFENRVELTVDSRANDGKSTHKGKTITFDEVIFACHSDQALRILCDASSVEHELLTTFPYGRNTAVLHTDTSVLPRRRRAWASWNYHIRRDRSQFATVTYNMNILQHIQSQHVFCVTLNESDAIDSAKIIRRIEYSHPIYTTQRAAVQRRHAELIRQNRTSFCGAYWGNGFHEDGVNSALRVCRAFEQQKLQLVMPTNRNVAARALA